MGPTSAGLLYLLRAGGVVPAVKDVKASGYDELKTSASTLVLRLVAFGIALVLALWLAEYLS